MLSASGWPSTTGFINTVSSGITDCILATQPCMTIDPQLERHSRTVLADT